MNGMSVMKALVFCHLIVKYSHKISDTTTFRIDSITIGQVKDKHKNYTRISYTSEKII